MFNLKKKIEISKPMASEDNFTAFLNAIKLENIVKVSAMVRHFDPKILNMHDHVSWAPKYNQIQDSDFLKNVYFANFEWRLEVLLRIGRQEKEISKY